MESVSGVNNQFLGISPKNSRLGKMKNTARKIGGALATKEKDLIQAFKDNDERKINMLSVEVKQLQRIQELFVTLLKAMHDLMMSIIRKIGL